MTTRSVKAAEAAVVRAAMLYTKSSSIGWSYFVRLHNACVRLAALRKKKGRK
jgi:hypothetical protein